MIEGVNELGRYPPLPAELLRNARIVPDRWSALPLWPTNAVIAEIGVAIGGFSRNILDVCRPRKFLGIDRYDLHNIEMLWGVPTATHFGGRTHLDFYRRKFADEIATGQVETLQGDSAQVIASLPDESVDVFYVDAGHTYDDVRADLEALRPKVKPDGWIVMNDYIPADTYFDAVMGVIQATNEFMVGEGWEMSYLALAPIMYCDVGLRRAPGWRPKIEADSKRVAALSQHVDELQAALAATRRSTSWRVTAPLRWAKQKLSGT